MTTPLFLNLNYVSVNETHSNIVLKLITIFVAVLIRTAWYSSVCANEREGPVFLGGVTWLLEANLSPNTAQPNWRTSLAPSIRQRVLGTQNYI